MGTVAERITFNHLTEDDFTDQQIVRMKREIRQLAAAMVKVSTERPKNETRLIAELALFMTTGTDAASCHPDLLAMLTSYAETSLAAFGEGGGQ